MELFFGVKAEQAALEDIAKPLSAEEAEEAEGDGDEVVAAVSAQRPGLDLAAEAAAREWGRRRRYRLGPGRIGWSPGMVVSAPIEAVEFEREIWVGSAGGAYAARL